MIGFKVLVTAGLLLIGGILVLNQQMNIGQFVAAEIIILLIINSVEKLILGLENFYDLLTALEKIGQVVDKELESQELSKPFEPNQNIGIELKDVSYKDPHDDKKILKDINFKVSPGERVLILGKNGSGKVFLRAAPAGTGIIAGGAIRSVCEVLGIQDVVAKSLGSANPHNVLKACVNGLKSQSSPKTLSAIRGKKIADIVLKREAK